MTTQEGFGFLDEYAKKEVRRASLKAVAIPGYQVPYSSREMPMEVIQLAAVRLRSWGTKSISDF
jgi:alpha-D-ribose 1-methylphosphonate 5-phosphate C-P lyase